MAYTKTSDSIIIKAALTQKGKKLLARGKFKVAKFALGDDEIDYRLYNSDPSPSAGYIPALKNAKLIESIKNGDSNIQFGLQSFDDGVLYLSLEQIEQLGDTTPHAFVQYLPVLVKNTKTPYAPTIRKDKYYVSVNDETSKLIADNVPNFKFLEINNLDKIKFVVESGILTPNEVDETGTSPDPGSAMSPTRENREKLILEKFLLDESFMVQADNRFISKIVGIQQTSQFEYFQSGDSIINFNTSLVDSPAISLDAGFEYFANFLIKGIANKIFTVDPTIPSMVDLMVLDPVAGLRKSNGFNISNLNGPRGSVTAFNVITNPELQVNSTGQRDDRFSTFGVLEEGLFSEIPTRKFDYIDTTIYIVGATTNSRLQIPLRIVRYAGIIPG